MNSKLTIPKKIRVGFVKRNDTYTGKLAYVVYVDSKGVLRKEKSWEGWRDKSISPIDYDNVPKDGFVLNKDAGGARRSYGWDTRIEKVRVYDRDGFEFEISIPNLLFILQECSAIKGKGLEGEFVYAWSGTELVLLPVSCSEYKSSVVHCEIQDQKVTAKDVVVGCTYLNKDQEPVMYLGKELWYEEKWVDHGYKMVGKKKHIFVKTNSIDKTNGYRYWVQDGFVKLAARTSDTASPDFAAAYEALKKTKYNSTAVKLFTKDVTGNGDNSGYYFGSYDERRSYCVPEDGIYYMVNLNEHTPYQYDSVTNKKIAGGWDIVYHSVIELVDGEFKTKYLNQREDPTYTGFYGSYNRNRYIIDKESKLAVSNVVAKQIVKELWVECENGVTYRYGNFAK
jgi:hypothetical protein